MPTPSPLLFLPRLHDDQSSQSQTQSSPSLTTTTRLSALPSLTSSPASSSRRLAPTTTRLQAPLLAPTLTTTMPSTTQVYQPTTSHPALDHEARPSSRSERLLRDALCKDQSTRVAPSTPRKHSRSYSYTPHHPQHPHSPHHSPHPHHSPQHPHPHQHHSPHPQHPSTSIPVSTTTSTSDDETYRTISGSFLFRSAIVPNTPLKRASSPDSKHSASQNPPRHIPNNLYSSSSPNHIYHTISNPNMPQHNTNTPLSPHEQVLRARLEHVLASSRVVSPQQLEEYRYSLMHDELRVGRRGSMKSNKGSSKSKKGSRSRDKDEDKDSGGSRGGSRARSLSPTPGSGLVLGLGLTLSLGGEDDEDEDEDRRQDHGRSRGRDGSRRDHGEDYAVGDSGNEVRDERGERVDVAVGRKTGGGQTQTPSSPSSSTTRNLPYPQTPHTPHRHREGDEREYVNASGKRGNSTMPNSPLTYRYPIPPSLPLGNGNSGKMRTPKTPTRQTTPQRTRSTPNATASSSAYPQSQSQSPYQNQYQNSAYHSNSPTVNAFNPSSTTTMTPSRIASPVRRHHDSSTTNVYTHSRSRSRTAPGSFSVGSSGQVVSGSGRRGEGDEKQGERDRERKDRVGKLMTPPPTPPNIKKGSGHHLPSQPSSSSSSQLLNASGSERQALVESPVDMRSSLITTQILSETIRSNTSLSLASSTTSGSGSGGGVPSHPVTPLNPPAVIIPSSGNGKVKGNANANNKFFRSHTHRGSYDDEGAYTLSPHPSHPHSHSHSHIHSHAHSLHSSPSPSPPSHSHQHSHSHTHTHSHSHTHIHDPSTDSDKTIKPFNVRRASAQCRLVEGYVSFENVEGLGGPPSPSPRSLEFGAGGGGGGGVDGGGDGGRKKFGWFGW